MSNVGLQPSRGHDFRQSLKGVLPPSILTMVRAIESGVQQRLYIPSQFNVWLRDKRSQPASQFDPGSLRGSYVEALLGWLARAQDAVSGGGVSGYYTFASGWSAAYPETTGYVITTLLEASRRLKKDEWATRARQMIEWEITVQLPDGSWQSGDRKSVV